MCSLVLSTKYQSNNISSKIYISYLYKKLGGIDFIY